ITWSTPDGRASFSLHAEGKGQAEADLVQRLTGRATETECTVERQALGCGPDESDKAAEGRFVPALDLREDLGHWPHWPGPGSFEDDAPKDIESLRAGERQTRIEMCRDRAKAVGKDGGALRADPRLVVHGRQEHPNLDRHARPRFVLQDALASDRLDAQGRVDDPPTGRFRRDRSQQQVLLALEHELPAIRETKVADQRGHDEKVIRSDPQQAGRSKLDLQGSALGDGCVRSIERPVRASGGREQQQGYDDRAYRRVDPFLVTPPGSARPFRPLPTCAPPGPN